MSNTVKIENLGPGVSELVIREGQAVVQKPPVDPLVTNLNGNIEAPFTYLEAKKELFTPVKTLVIVEEHALKITFKTDETSHLGHTISGQLKRSRLLWEFGVNETTNFTDKNLAKLLRKLPFLFADKQAVEKLYNSLMNFSAQVQTTLENIKDNTGNVKQLFEKKVKTDLPPSIVFECPIFEGQETVKFLAFLCAEATNSGVVFYFDSPELYELEEKERKRILALNVQKFIDYGSAVIYV